MTYDACSFFYLEVRGLRPVTRATGEIALTAVME